MILCTYKRGYTLSYLVNIVAELIWNLSVAFQINCFRKKKQTGCFKWIFNPYFDIHILFSKKTRQYN